MEEIDTRSRIERVGANFTQIPNDLINDIRFHDSKSGTWAKLLLIYVYSKPLNWQFYRENIAEEMGINTRTLDRAIKTAKDLGWLDVYQEDIKSKSGRVVSTRPVWHVKLPEKLIVDEEKTGLTNLTNPPRQISRTPLDQNGNVSKTEISNTKRSNTNVRKSENPQLVGTD